MKIRNGFVSNSSSSSFIITALDKHKLKTKWNTICKSLHGVPQAVGLIKEFKKLEKKDIESYIETCKYFVDNYDEKQNEIIYKAFGVTKTNDIDIDNLNSLQHALDNGKTLWSIELGDSHGHIIKNDDGDALEYIIRDNKILSDKFTAIISNH